MRLRPWQLALAVLGSALFLGVTPFTVYNASLLLLGRSCGWAWAAVRAVPLPLHPLRAAMLNVTADYDQLAHLVAEFLEQPTVDPAVRQQFVTFMAQRATRSYPRFEAALDWLLSIYKFLFPFLIISMAAKLGGGNGGEPPLGAAGMEGAPADGGLGAARGGADDNGSLLASESPSASGLQLARLATQPSGGWAVPPLPLSQEEQRRLAISRAIARAKGSQAGAAGAAAGADRAGSQSPRGPGTPVEALRSGLPAHPAAQQQARGAGAVASQRSFGSEIMEGGL